MGVGLLVPLLGRSRGDWVRVQPQLVAGSWHPARAQPAPGPAAGRSAHPSRAGGGRELGSQPLASSGGWGDLDQRASR